MIKEFLKKHSHLKLGLQHLELHGGGWKIEIYNTTYNLGLEPVFEHYITDDKINNLNVDFETAIITPIVNWLEDCEERRKKNVKR